MAGWYTAQMEPVATAVVTTTIALAKALKDLNDLRKCLPKRVPPEVRDRVSELCEQIVNVQVATVAARERESELTERCHELQEELRRVNDWETQKDRYTLRKIDGLAFVFVPEPAPPRIDESEARHWLCARCFEDRKKSHLQATGERVNYHLQRWKCPRCDAAVVVGWRTQPG